MIRKRSLHNWKKTYSYDSTDDFYDSVTRSGLHSIYRNSEVLDFFIQRRRSETLLVFFHGSITSSYSTVPIILGRTLASELNFNLISFSDPALALGDLNVGWFLGNAKIGRLPVLLANIIRHTATKLKCKNIILFGGSGGGFAALNVGQMVDNSKILIANPRLNLVGKPRSEYQQFLDASFTIKDRESAFAASARNGSVTLKDSLIPNFEFDLYIWQNDQDRHFLRHQVQPFLKRFELESRLYVKFSSMGKGHVAPPRFELLETLRILGANEHPSDFHVYSTLTADI